MTNDHLGHQQDQASDFRAEVEAIKSVWQDMKAAIAEGAPVQDGFATRVSRAMEFVHGRGPVEIEAKADLREIEREMMARDLEYVKAERDMWKASAQEKRRRLDARPVTVWLGSMPESNGKSNWTALLMPVGGELWEGVTLECSEYKDRVRYAADRVRFLLGEIAEEPDIMAYDPDLLVSAAPHGGTDDAATMVGNAPARIESISDLHAAVGPKNVVLVEYGDNRMATVSVNGRHVMTGNVWDFHPGCHGGWFYELAAKWRSFRRPMAMAEAISMEIRDYANQNALDVSVSVREGLDVRE